MHEITELLHAYNSGDEQAFNRLMPLVDSELKNLARNYMRQEQPGNILQTTALVNEALIKLIKEKIRLNDRNQFYGFVAKRMRQVLIGYAREQGAAKRGRRPEQLDTAEAEKLGSSKAIAKARELVTLDEALAALGKIGERKVAVIEYRFFIGLSIDETAEAMGVSKRTVERDWEFSQAWLKAYMTGIEK